MPIAVRDAPRAAGGLVRTVTLERPDKRNALDDAHLADLARAFHGCLEHDVRCVVVTGAGTAFCAGYDLSGAPRVTDDTVIECMEIVRACPVPVLAVVNGPAYGAGFELAISADIRLASRDATFCLPPAKLGIAYAPKALARLVGLVGTGVARRLAFTAEVVSAERALPWGLVEEVVAPDALAGRAEQLAESLAALAPLAVRTMKRTFDALEPRLKAGDVVRIEAARLQCFDSDDAKEGLAAALAKRPPRYRGN